MTPLSHTVVFLLWMGCATCKASAGAACEDPPLIDFGEIVSGHKSAYKESDRVQYLCNPGYTLSGSERLTCHEKIWVPGPPQCLAPCTITKQQLEAQNLLLSNGQRRTFLIQSGQRQEFMCTTGFKLTASPIKQCFNGHIELPSCVTEMPCGSIPKVPNAQIEGRNKEMYEPGETIRYQCDAGFLTVGPPEIICREGNWTAPPFCEDVSCGAAPEIPNAYITSAHQERYLPGARVQYECDSNFQMMGGNYVTCTNRKWSQAPTCRGKGGKCGPPPVIENGDLLSFPMQEYPQGTTLEYKCPSLYVLEGSQYITCTDGQWTSPPVCLVACAASEEDMGRNNVELKWVPERKLYVRSGDVIEFQCKRGYLEDPASSPFRAQCVEGTIEYPRCKPGRSAKVILPVSENTQMMKLKLN
ncbi:complement factor H-related protein 2-like [Mycteria americana]|uniref:complement factor H-related protein 2-like n=1 Tax=Mycteria americana TaxID=33587 RepID=UPI003F5867FB